MDCRRRSVVDDDRSRRIKLAVDDDRRRRRGWEVDDYPPLQLPLQWRDPPPQYPPLELPLKWRSPLPDHLIHKQTASIVHDPPPLRPHSVDHDSSFASTHDQDRNPASLSSSTRSRHQIATKPAREISSACGTVDPDLLLPSFGRSKYAPSRDHTRYPKPTTASNSSVSTASFDSLVGATPESRERQLTSPNPPPSTPATPTRPTTGSPLSDQTWATRPITGSPVSDKTCNPDSPSSHNQSHDPKPFQRDFGTDTTPLSRPLGFGNPMHAAFLHSSTIITSEVVQVLTDLNLIIIKTYISSDGGWIMGIFNITDHEGKKIRDETTIKLLVDYIRKSLWADSSFLPRRRSVDFAPSSDYTSVELSGGSGSSSHISSDGKEKELKHVSKNKASIIGMTSLHLAEYVFTVGVKTHSLNSTCKANPMQCSQAARRNVAKGFEPNLKRLEEVVQKLDKVPAKVSPFLHLLESINRSSSVSCTKHVEQDPCLEMISSVVARIRSLLARKLSCTETFLFYR